MWAKLLPWSVRRPLAFCILIFSSETTGPIWTKLWLNNPWVVSFQNYVQQPQPPTKMATIAKNRTFGKKSSPLKLLCQLGPNYGGIVFRWSTFRIISDNPGRQPRWPPLLKIENLAKNPLKIISSENSGPVGPKQRWNGLYMVHFQNCFRWPRPPSKMAAISGHSFNIGPYGKNVLKIFPETSKPILSKYGMDGP